MKNAILFLMLLIIACATQQQQSYHNGMIKKVDIRVIKTDSLYSMIVSNKIDSLTFDDVANNFMTLIESQQDTVILRDLTSSFNDFAGYPYSVHRYNKINKQFEGEWILTGAELTDTITLDTSNYNFKFPNLLAVSYKDSWIYFSVNNSGKSATGTYNDNVVKLTK